MASIHSQNSRKIISTNFKAILIIESVLIAPDFQKQFKLAIEASDVECGVVDFSVVQKGEDGIDLPISNFSKKFDCTQFL